MSERAKNNLLFVATFLLLSACLAGRVLAASAPLCFFNIDPATLAVTLEYGTEQAQSSTANINLNSGRTAGAIDTIEIGGHTYELQGFWGGSAGFLYHKIRIDGGAWTVYTSSVACTDLDDGHYTCNWAFDPDGYVHVWYDMHASALKYRKSSLSVTNGSYAGTLGSATSMRGGSNEDTVTYPVPFRDPGDHFLYLIYREGGSGNGDVYFLKYAHATTTWAGAAGTSTDGRLTDGNTGPTTPNNAYFLHPPVFSSDWDGAGAGKAWFSYSYRQAADPDDFSMVAFYWNGSAFKKPDDSSQTVPITTSNDTVVDSSADLSSARSLAIDNNEHPHVLIYDNGSALTRHWWHNGTTWVSYDFAAGSPTGGAIIFDATNRAVVIYRDASDFKLKAMRSDASDFTTWTKITLVDDVIGALSLAPIDRNRYQTTGAIRGQFEYLPLSLWSGYIQSTSLDQPTANVTDFTLIGGASGSTYPSEFWTDFNDGGANALRFYTDDGTRLPGYVVSSTDGGTTGSILWLAKAALTTSHTKNVRIYVGLADAEALPVNHTYGRYNCFGSFVKTFGFGLGDDQTRNLNALTLVGSPTLNNDSGPINGMAATTLDGTTQAGSANASVPTAIPVVLLARVKQASYPSSMTWLALSDTATATNYWAGKTTSAAAVRATTRAGGSEIVNDVGTLSTNTWHYVVDKHSGNTVRQPYFDLTSGANTVTTTAAPSSVDTIGVGAAKLSTGFAGFFGGSIATYRIDTTNQGVDYYQFDYLQTADPDQSDFYGTWAYTSNTPAASGLLRAILQYSAIEPRHQSPFAIAP